MKIFFAEIAGENCETLNEEEENQEDFNEENEDEVVEEELEDAESGFVTKEVEFTFLSYLQRFF